jgi:hypothetical protein
MGYRWMLGNGKKVRILGRCLGGEFKSCYLVLGVV